jgi:hypothetical protein
LEVSQLRQRGGVEAVSTPRSKPAFSVQNSEHFIPSMTLLIGRMEIWRVVPAGEAVVAVLEKLIIAYWRDESLL